MILQKDEKRYIFFVEEFQVIYVDISSSRSKNMWTATLQWRKAVGSQNQHYQRQAPDDKYLRYDEQEMVPVVFLPWP